MNLETSTFTIHPIRDPEDLPAILEVYRQCEDFLALGPVATASLAMVQADLALSRSLNATFCGIFDRQSAEMIGVLDYVREGYHGKPEVAYLNLLMIAIPWRNRGLGAQVVAALEAEIRKTGKIQAIEAGVQVNNYGAVRFWQRMGYRITSPAKDFGDGTAGFDLRKDFKG